MLIKELFYAPWGITLIFLYQGTMQWKLCWDVHKHYFIYNTEQSQGQKRDPPQPNKLGIILTIVVTSGYF
jgi:hypothetical protein